MGELEEKEQGTEQILTPAKWRKTTNIWQQLVKEFIIIIFYLLKVIIHKLSKALVITKNRPRRTFQNRRREEEYINPQGRQLFTSEKRIN